MTDLIPQPLPERKKRNVFIDLRKFLSDINIRATRGAFQSANFIQNVTGWRLNADGLIEGARISLNNYVERDDESITFSGSWTNSNLAAFYAFKSKISSTVGDYFEITFTGTSIGIPMETAGNLGKIDFVLDDGETETVDLYRSSGLTTRSLVYQKTGLSLREHTLRGTIATKNPSSNGNFVRFQGYVKSPTAGIRVEDISADIFISAENVLTDGNGYATTSVFSLPSGWNNWCIIGAYLTEAVMSDATTTDPKVSWARDQFYIYNGAAATTYQLNKMFLISQNS